MIGPQDKLFLITRADLSAGQQAVQSAHALREFTARHPDIDREWYEVSNYLALLSVENEERLGVLLKEAQVRGIPAAAFYEPDRDGELTAIALAPCPAAKRLCRGIPLALVGL